ncbi:MAG: winged helix-turn-helix transcriptional regulator [Rhodospirillaceae bacterium]|jgi:DNA-binding MarR family transcriptional regulator|nr:winged helix-turn-helix transcriptional regulator [Rhodospirillaceae bacterium]
MPKASNNLDLDTHLPALIQTLGNKISLHALRGGAGSHSLDLREWRIILILGAEGRSTINEVADRVAMDRGGTSRSISRLEQRGLIERFDDSKDRRRSLVDLNTTGVSIHKDLVQFSKDREKLILKNVALTDQKLLNELLHKLIDNLDQLLDGSI